MYSPIISTVRNNAPGLRFHKIKAICYGNRPAQKRLNPKEFDRDHPPGYLSIRIDRRYRRTQESLFLVGPKCESSRSGLTVDFAQTVSFSTSPLALIYFVLMAVALVTLTEIGM
jgi:hypothetical protein